jgi:multiple sugar transport system permease protein
MMAAAAEVRPVVRTTRSGVRRSRKFGYLLLTPAILYIVLLVGVPFGLAIWYSLSDVSVNNLNGKFVGLTNYVNLFHDPTFRQALENTFVYTIATAIIVGILGTLLAFILLANFPGKRVIRFLILLPWTIPIALTIESWKWMFFPQYSVLNWLAIHAHILSGPYGIVWLGNPDTALPAVITVNVWRNFAFGAIILLAGLTSIPPDIIDAARIDGAGFLRRFHYIMVPMMLPILFIGLLFTIVFTFTDLTIVFLLTNGGPGNASQVLANYAFLVGISSGDLSHGAAITLFLLPVLLLVSVLFLRQLRRRDV